jgi:hypothetical protein
MSANWLHHRPDQPGQQAMPVRGPLSGSPARGSEEAGDGC